jgi:hypothetical protein
MTGGDSLASADYQWEKAWRIHIQLHSELLH